MGLFGGITRALFGGGKSKNESGNQFASDIYGAYGPAIEQGNASMGQMANILGLNGPDMSSEALNNWWDSSGGQFQLNQGVGDITDKMASLGVSISGPMAKALEGYRQGLASTSLQNYLGNLGDLSRLGLGAGGLVTSAGQYSKGKNTSSGGGLGAILGGILASDPDLKTDVKPVGKLGIYEFRYKGDKTVHRGLMADEVEERLPAAAGPRINGFRTISLSKLAEAQHGAL